MEKKKEKAELETLIYDILHIIDCYSKIDNIYEESFGICPLHDIMKNVGSMIEEYANNKLEKENKKLNEENKELRKWIKEHVNYQTQADFRKRFEHK